MTTTTVGSWATENESKEALDDVVAEWFDIHTEVHGTCLQPKLDRAKEAVSYRIDRVLVPRPRLLELGWIHGPIGIEVKASGRPLGPALAQAFDYTRAAWFVRDTWIMLPWLFVWPAEKTHGTLASILSQHRIGTAEPAYGGIKLASGESVLACLGGIYEARIGAGTNGRRVGSR